MEEELPTNALTITSVAPSHKTIGEDHKEGREGDDHNSIHLMLLHQ